MRERGSDAVDKREGHTEGTYVSLVPDLTISKLDNTTVCSAEWYMHFNVTV